MSVHPRDICRCIQKARHCALQSKYEAALEYYAAANDQIENYIHLLGDAVLRGKWSSLRDEVDRESATTQGVLDELRCLVDPAQACRIERYANTEYAREKTRRISVPKPSTDSGAMNQRLYGDRDRFGPPEGPVAAVTAAAGPRNPSRTVARAATPLGGRQQAGRPTATTRVVRRSNATGSIGPSRREEHRKEGGSGHRAVPRFTGRPGEEELVQLIEADMHFGKMPVSWDDIAGLEEAKHLLEEAVVYPVLMPDYYQGIRRPWKGVLMYGPPGTGKTMLAKAVASQCSTTFFNISPATLTSKWRGESEKLIRVLFEMARHYAPSTIFIDEIDSLCGQRGGSEEHEASRRAKGTLLAQMDGVGAESSKIVMVLGATNHPWDIDEAMRRRLEKRIYIPLPDRSNRVQLFQINAKSLMLSPDVDFEQLSDVLEGHYYSCADITNLVRDAAMMTMRRYIKVADKSTLREKAAEIGRRVAEQPVTMADFMSAVTKVPSSINVDNVRKFERWKKEFEFNV